MEGINPSHGRQEFIYRLSVRIQTRRCYLDPIMIEELQKEINRVIRKSFIKTNLDAQACYDRMIPSLTSIVSQKYGMDSKICAVQSKTLETA